MKEKFIQFILKFVPLKYEYSYDNYNGRRRLGYKKLFKIVRYAGKYEHATIKGWL